MGSLKRFNLQKIISSYLCKTLIVVGAGNFDALQFSANCGFSQLYAVENTQNLYETLRDLFSDDRSVSIVNQDKVGFLRKFHSSFGDYSMYFLDNIFDENDDIDGSYLLLNELDALLEFDLSHSIIIINYAWLYFDINTQNGICPENSRRWSDKAELIKRADQLKKSHEIFLLVQDEGYLVIVPKDPGLDFTRMGNICAHDSSGLLNYAVGVSGVTSISILRRLADSRFASRYFRGFGLDIGGGSDSIALYTEFFPLVRNVFVYDQGHGDAQFVANIADNSFDFVYSSHCLEHLRDAEESLKNWIRVVKPGGYLIISVPDEDLYEQGVWPSRYNPDHKISFTISKEKSWSPVSVNVIDLLGKFKADVQILAVSLLDQGYRYQALPKGIDQTRSPMAECGIEFILRKLVL